MGVQATAGGRQSQKALNGRENNAVCLGFGQGHTVTAFIFE